MDCDRELVQEGHNILKELQQNGYNEIICKMAHSAVDFLENLHTLTGPLRKFLPTLASLDIPLMRGHNEATTGLLVLKCSYSCDEWKSLLQGLIPSAFDIIDHVKAEVTVKDHEETPLGFNTEFYIKARGSDLTEYCPKSDGRENVLTDGVPKISPATFCRIQPFHIMLNKNLIIVQIGHSLARIMQGFTLNRYHFNEKFELLSPAVETSYGIWKEWKSIPVILKYKNSKVVPKDTVTPKKSDDKLQRSLSHPIKGKGEGRKGELCLRGQISYIPESDRFLFLGSPSVQSIRELSNQSLFLSDIPLHDSTRDLLLLNEQLMAEQELAKKLENTTLSLEEICREMEAEKELSDNLVYSILPNSVAQHLRSGRPVEAKKYRSISILFCGICNFDNFCNTLPPMEVVDLLNDIYTKFDALADPVEHGVYKMETVGDKYMLVSGLPEKNTFHARNITRAALDMMDIVNKFRDTHLNVQVQIGVHTGDVVAGVVGQKLPHYAVFGGTVCLASRMESTGGPGRVNLSATAHSAIWESGCEAEFVFEDRGLLQIKGWSEDVQCYFVQRHAKDAGRKAIRLGYQWTDAFVNGLLPT